MSENVFNYSNRKILQVLPTYILQFTYEMRYYFQTSLLHREPRIVNAKYGTFACHFMSFLYFCMPFVNTVHHYMCKDLTDTSTEFSYTEYLTYTINRILRASF